MADNLSQIRDAINSFNVDQARELLREALKEPSAETFYLASLVALNAEQKIHFLKQAVNLDPFHVHATQALANHHDPSPSVSPNSKSEPSVISSISRTSTGSVKIVGSKQSFAVQPDITVFIDDTENTKVRLIDEIAIELPVGKHTIRTKLGPRKSNSETFEVKANETVVFRLSTSRIWGTIKLERYL